MFYYRSKNSMKYILFAIIIFIYKGKIISDNSNIKKKDLYANNMNKICELSDLINSIYFQDSNNTDTYEIELKLGRNNINFTNDYSNFSLNLNEQEIQNKDLIIYTNLKDKLSLITNEKVDNISFSFNILENEYINRNQTIKFRLNPGNKTEKGFIELRLENKGEFYINKDIIRESFYKRDIILNKSESKNLYFINYIPSDNNSDCYYLQYSFDPDKSSEKKKIKLYYLNKLNDKSLDEIIKDFKDKEVKRDRNIRGKIEIFGIEYKDLKKNIKLELKYNRIKGEGTTGFILTLSILFFILIIIVGIFIRNAYCGNLKRFSISDESLNEQ